jgi:Flp pilus assembly secretin CpaC
LIELMPNMVRLLDMDRPFGEVFTGSAEVAGTTIVTDRSVTITARGTGQTSIMFLGVDNRPVLLAEVRVVPTSRGSPNLP